MTGPYSLKQGSESNEVAFEVTGRHIPKLKILLVDDYEDSRFVLRKFLESQGHKVLEAVNGLEAVEMAESARPDLILLDLHMPVLDGLLAAERIRASGQACQHVPIIAITAFDTYGMKEAALEVGCNAYLSKPIDFVQMERVIHRTFDNYSTPTH